MKDGSIFKNLLENPEGLARLPNLKDRYLLLLAFAYKDDPDGFKVLEGFRFPEGQATLISTSKEKILNGQSSAVAAEIYESPYFAEVGHDSKTLARLLDLTFIKLGYSPGVRNQIKALLFWNESAEELLQRGLNSKPS